jgi:hypothetical protein
MPEGVMGSNLHSNLWVCVLIWSPEARDARMVLRRQLLGNHVTQDRLHAVVRPKQPAHRAHIFSLQTRLEQQ